MSREAAAFVETQPMSKLCTDQTWEALNQEEEQDKDEEEEFPHPIPWQKIEAQGLDCDYGLLFSKDEASRLFRQLEEEVEYFTGTKECSLSLRIKDWLCKEKCNVI